MKAIRANRITVRKEVFADFIGDTKQNRRLCRQVLRELGALSIRFKTHYSLPLDAVILRGRGVCT